MKFILFITLLLSINLYSQTVPKVYLENNNNTLIEPFGEIQGHHTLIGFEYENVLYSTGANDNLLENYYPSKFKSLKPFGITLGSSSYYGTPTNYGDTLPDSLTNTYLLYDGDSGLDISTGIFNASGFTVYKMDSINNIQITDDVPDIIFTQIGDPSATLDEVYFTDENGAKIGQSIKIGFNTISPIYKQHYYLYRTSDKKKSFDDEQYRDVRVIAYKLSDFGIDNCNYRLISRFVHKLSGSSDQAFIAFNELSFNALPIELLDFNIREYSQYENIIEIITKSEQNNNHFIIEFSKDGYKWHTLDIIESKVNSNTEQKYSYIFSKTKLFNGTNYIRLKQVDINNDFTVYNPISYMNKIIESKLILKDNSPVIIYDNQGRMIYEGELDEIELSPGNIILIDNYIFK